MKVLKFGGTSVADAKNINKVIDIILENERNTVVIVSALGGITDELIKLATLASKGDLKYKIQRIRGNNRKYLCNQKTFAFRA